MQVAEHHCFLLAYDSVIRRFDYALFADTEGEPGTVYENFARLHAHAKQARIPVHTVSATTIRTDALILNTGSCQCHCVSRMRMAPET